MITRELLLANGFDFRVYDGSKFPNGEYTKRVSGNANIIRIGYNAFFKWNYEISNYNKLIYFKAYNQDNISIKTLQKLLDLAEVKLKLINHGNK